ncbi:MAG: hypothetical protein U0625_11700 [Phycisphaerales bacterium]
MRHGRASVLFDPGWLFLVAGLVLVASAVLVPASYDLWVMRTQMRHLDARETENYRRLEAYSRFVHDLESAEPQLVRRLAASQLNLVPRGETPLAVASSARQTPIQWVDATVQPVQPVVAPFPDSLLSRLTLGRKALWVAGAGAMCIFLGLLSAPIRMPVPEPPSLEGAGDAAANAAARIMGLANGQARGVQLAGFDAETTSSAIAGRRMGVEAPHESNGQAHGAD